MFCESSKKFSLEHCVVETLVCEGSNFLKGIWDVHCFSIFFATDLVKQLRQITSRLIKGVEASLFTKKLGGKNCYAVICNQRLHYTWLGSEGGCCGLCRTLVKIDVVENNSSFAAYFLGS